MPGIVTKRFRIHNAEQFKEAFSEASGNIMYLFIGRVHAWPDGDTTPTPTDSVYNTRYQPWRDMIAAKRITNTDVTFCAPKYTWSSGTVYTEYDHTDTSLYSNAFYVINSSSNVYKCLFNNYGAQSTIEPSGTSTSLITTSDGYIWKFMYSISGAESLKFVTNSYVPVKTLTADDGSAQWDVQQAASNGSIDIIRLTSNGSGYVHRSSTFASVTSSTVQVLDGAASGTDNFYTGGSLFISSGLGSGQVRTISAYNGTTKQVTVSPGFNVTPNSSSTFHVGPTIQITGDGRDAAAYANVSAGILTRVTMVNTGANYSRASVTIFDGQGGSNTGAAAVPRISPPNGHGSDPVGELGGYNVMLNSRLTGTESGSFPGNNDFRIIGLLRDPLLANGAIADGSSYYTTTKLTVTGIASGPFQNDEFINGGTTGAQGRIVNFANTNAAATAGIIDLVNVVGTFGQEVITGNTSSATATVASFANGQLQPFSGDVLYNEYRAGTTRNPDQIEDIKLVVRY
jgi:hypothetical protein